MYSYRHPEGGGGAVICKSDKESCEVSDKWGDREKQKREGRAQEELEETREISEHSR